MQCVEVGIDPEDDGLAVDNELPAAVFQRRFDDFLR
jgi:hypothetical protein